MSKRPNPTIGIVLCPMCESDGAVRKSKDSRFYYVCACGVHRNEAFTGQEWILKNANIWGDGDPPEDAPDWIRRGLGHPPGTRSVFSRPRTPVPATDRLDDGLPAPEDEPEDETAGIFGFR
jgi:hypothetical protein